MIAGLLTLAAIYALRVASTFLLPVVIACLMALLLAPPMRWILRRGVSSGIAAGLLVIAVVGALSGGVALLLKPATTWLDRAPDMITEVQRKARSLTRPLEPLQETAEKVDEVTGNGRASKDATIAPAGLFRTLSRGTFGFLGGLLTVIFLTYFLLATGDRFAQKLSELLPEHARQRTLDLMREMESQMSGYLWQTTLINIGVGMVTWGVLALLGMPNALLWGVVAAILNYIPYIGAVVTFVILGVAAFVSFPTAERPLMILGAFLVINTIEANLVVPMVLGRRLPLNPVAIFLGLLFWGWIWGVSGAVLAVPLTVLVKVVADRFRPLQPLGVMLGN